MKAQGLPKNLRPPFTRHVGSRVGLEEGIYLEIPVGHNYGRQDTADFTYGQLGSPGSRRRAWGFGVLCLVSGRWGSSFG